MARGAAAEGGGIALKTMQGIETRRRHIRLLLICLALYTVTAFAAVSLARLTVWPALSDLIADATSEWFEVSPDQAGWYRVAGYQEGMTVSGTCTFRDLSEYRWITGILTGPVLWSIYAAGLVAVALGVTMRGARDVDELVYAVERAASGESPRLPEALGRAQASFEALEERGRARERAMELAESRKNELVAYLAHDIRTPLTSIIGYLSLLAEEPDLPLDRRGRYARTAFEKARRLDSMMDEFFEITRYNISAIPLEREQTDIRLLLEQIADELYPAANARGMTIAVDAPDGLEAFIDAEKMARALANLMKNGISYADAGSELSCRARIEGGAVVMEVEDTGKEIAPDHLARVFEKFYREDAARGTCGAGLGLAIAREIVEAHGGTVSAASERGVTTFTVRVPVR